MFAGVNTKIFQAHMPIRIIAGLITAFFLFASSIKLLGWQSRIFERWVEFFVSYGLNREVMFLIGLVELFGAVAICFQGRYWGMLGAAAIAFTSAAAIVYHFRFDSVMAGSMAMTTLTLSAVVLLYNVDQVWQKLAQN